MKNIVIIGHSSGIGKALTEKLAAENEIYGTCYQTPVDFQHENIHSHYLDVTGEAPDFSFMPETIDGLVYCPGAIQLKPFGRIKEAEFMADYQLQVLGAVKVIQHCLPGLKKSAAPSIVLFSTVAVQVGFSFHSLVSAHKGAIEGLTKALAAEFAPNIRVNCLAPSITDTPLASSLLSSPEKVAAHAQRNPLKRIGRAEDLANAAAFLLREESAWMTGQILHIDGGMSTLRI